MKKFLLIICAMALTVGASGCASAPAADTPATAESQSDGEMQSAGEATQPELANGNPQGEITVSCYDSTTYKDFLELAAQSFEAKYPGTKINIDAPSQMGNVSSGGTDGEQRLTVEVSEDEEGKSDYISKINTGLIGGSGPDILAADIIPVYKFADNGQLENLQPYIESDSSFNAGDYRQNIFDALKFKNGQYIFPLDYSFNYYSYDSTLLDEAAQGNFVGYKGFTVGELAHIAQLVFANDPATKVFNMQSVSMVKELMEENYTHFVDLENKTANFGDGTFADILDHAKGYEDGGYIDAASEVDLSDFSGDTNARQIYKLKRNMALLVGYMLRDGMPVSFPLDGTVPGVENDDKPAGIQMGVNGEVKFNYSQGYGINSASTNKALAWEFIKFMAGSEMQESLQMFPMGLLSLPVHNEARAKKLEDGIRLSLFAPEEETLKNAELTDVQKQDLEELIRNTEGFSDMINTYCFKDNTVDSIISSELEYFFDGSKSAADTAASIQSKVEMYFNE